MTRATGVAAAVVVLFAVPWFAGAYVGYVACLAASTFFAVFGLSILIKYAGTVSLGQSAFVGIGAYTEAIATLKWGWPFPAAFAAGVVLGALVGFVLGCVCWRLSGPALSVVTLVFGWTIPELATHFDGITGGYVGLSPAPITLFGYHFAGYPQLFALMLACAIVVSVLAALGMSRGLGRALRAVKDAPFAAATFGIRAPFYKLYAFTLAGALGAISGLFAAPLVGYVAPTNYGFWPSLYLVAGAILGGEVDVAGAAIGAFVVSFVPVLTGSSQRFSSLIYGALIVLTVMFMRGGMSGFIGVGLLRWNHRRPATLSTVAEPG